jgi:hypothetical protein
MTARYSTVGSAVRDVFACLRSLACLAPPLFGFTDEPVNGIPLVRVASEVDRRDALYATLVDIAGGLVAEKYPKLPVADALTSWTRVTTDVLRPLLRADDEGMTTA